MGQRRVWLILALLLVVIGLPVGWYLLSPLFIERVVSEDLPPALREAMAPALKEAAAKQKAMTEPMPGPAKPALVARGEFMPIAHEGRGRALVYLAETGELLLRFEGFYVLNGPDLRVYMVRAPVVKSRADVREYLELGKLKGNRGDQNYLLPTGFDLAAYRSVVIWCHPFRVAFASASLAPVSGG
ncbi:MAG TPA: DM13 domain-containing protein [Candidatus Methylomirabilis sp.]|nr:DM13 domain-containing protein [Candidatus Methylomirabilis sp.]